MTTCPICDLLNQNVNNSSLIYSVICKRCGQFRCSLDLVDDIPHYANTKPFFRIALSSHIRRYYQKSSNRIADSDLIEKIIKDYSRPNPAEQAHSALLHFADQGEEPSFKFNLDPEELQGVIGAQEIDGVVYVLKELEKQGVLMGSWNDFLLSSGSTMSGVLFSAQITFLGWTKIEELRVSNSQSKTAFMAMKFGNDELNGVLEDHIKPAVLATGFMLRKLDDEPKAGLIDARMRLEIRNAKFLIADLSDGNAGAYWEAGFAEGLGKAVIYLCKKEIFENPKTRPHFDTNHHLTIVWDTNNIGSSMKMLKNTIRYTFPEAKQID